MTCIAFESFAVTTALPVVAAELDATQWYSLAFAATITTTLVGMTIGGNWADRRGVRVPLLIGGSLFLLGLLLCVLAPNMTVFIAGRLLQGLGGGIHSVVVYVVIAQFIPEPLRPRVFGVMTSVWLLPAMIGPLLTGVLIEAVHWRVVFAIALLGAASLGGLLAVTRGAKQISADVPNVGRRGMWAIVAAIGVFGLHLAGQSPPTELMIGIVFAVAVVGVAALRLLPRGTLRGAAGIPRLIVLRGLLGASVAASDIYLLSIYNMKVATPRLSPDSSSLSALSDCSRAHGIQGRSRSAAGNPAILLLSSIFVVCGPLGVILFVTGLAPIPVTIIGCVVMGGGMALAYPQITSAMLALSPTDQQGINSSALQVAESLSTSTTLATTGAILTLTGTVGYFIDYTIAAGLAVWAVAIAIAVQTHNESPRS